jgi:hypothetical protein
MFKFWLALAWSTELRGTGVCDRHAATINILPDDIFLEIFAFCLRDYGHSIECTRIWQRLVHVCQRWRQIIYASPRYLDLHLFCSNGTPFRKCLSYWPPFPISIAYRLPNSDYRDHHYSEDEDDHDVELIAALEHPDRVHHVDLDITTSGSRVEEVVAMMQVPFPVLTHLELTAYMVSALPDGFLGKSAPCLQHLRLAGVPFPDLPSLLLSACDLVSLQLDCIPPTGFISPEAMVMGLAGLTRLRTLSIRSPILSPEQTRRLPDPPMLTVLPALTQFVIGGNNEYVEDLLAQIDTPQVDGVVIEYPMQEVQTRQLSKFMDRTANFKLAQFRRAQVTLNNDAIYIELDRPQVEHRRAHLSVAISGGGLDFQVSYMVHVLGQLDAMLSNVGHLSVRVELGFGRQDDVDRTEWLLLLHLFRAVETMHVCRAMAWYIASALEDIAEEMVTEVLPALHLLYLEDVDDGDNKDNDDYDYDSDYDFKSVGSTERFLSLRQLSGLPVTIVKTEDEFVERLFQYGPSALSRVVSGIDTFGTEDGY